MGDATTRIVIDTDPGQDDAVAILLALASPEIEVLGICSVAGNVPLPLTTLNVLKVCELAGRPDVRGRAKNVHFVREVDDAAFFALLTERIARL